MAASIFVVGSSNTDMVVKTERLPLPGETVLGGQFFMNPGGKGANQAVAAARLGGAVTLVARVGADTFGEQALKQFSEEGIDTAFISSDPDHPSGVALINVDGKGENSITVAAGANMQLLPEVVRNAVEAMDHGSLVLLQLEIPLSTVAFVVKEAAGKGARVILNPAPAQEIPDDLLSKLYLITPNESEAQLLTGVMPDSDEAVAEAARVLHGKGVQRVVITLGKRGAYWSDGTQQGWVAAPEVAAMDTTAAGDCFNGALVVALGEGTTLAEAVRFACRAAAVSVTRMGAQASMPYRYEL